MDFFDRLNIKAEKDGIVKRVVGGVILNERNEILLLKRREDDFMGGIYEIPSGNLENDESIQDGLIREIKEETAYDVSNIGVFINTFDYLSGSGKKSRQFNFEVKVSGYDEIFLTEHDEYKWVSFDEMKSMSDVTDELKYTLCIFEYNKSKK